MSARTALIQRIALYSAILGAIATGVLWFQFGPHSGLSAAVGALVGVTNLWVLARLVQTILDERSPGARRGRAVIFLGLKTLALVTLVGILVVNGWVRGGAMMAGLSVVALSIVLATVMHGGGGDDDGSNSDAAHGTNDGDNAPRPPPDRST